MLASRIFLLRESLSEGHFYNGYWPIFDVLRAQSNLKNQPETFNLFEGHVSVKRTLKVNPKKNSLDCCTCIKNSFLVVKIPLESCKCTRSLRKFTHLFVYTFKTYDWSRYEIMNCMTAFMTLCMIRYRNINAPTLLHVFLKNKGALCIYASISVQTHTHTCIITTNAGDSRASHKHWALWIILIWYGVYGCRALLLLLTGRSLFDGGSFSAWIAFMTGAWAILFTLVVHCFLK